MNTFYMYKKSNSMDRVFCDDLAIVFLINEYPQHLFSWRNKEKNTHSYLEVWNLNISINEKI